MPRVSKASKAKKASRSKSKSKAQKKVNKKATKKTQSKKPKGKPKVSSSRKKTSPSKSKSQSRSKGKVLKKPSKVKSKARSSSKKKSAAKTKTKSRTKTKASIKRRGQSTTRSKSSSTKTSLKAAPRKRKLVKKLSQDMLLQAYTLVLRARLTDKKTVVLYKQNKCHFQISVAGHGAAQVAAGMVFRSGKDWFYPYYRDMALCAALGMDSRSFMLNAMNKQLDPNSHGRQMPMHYGSTDLRIVNQSSPTGTQFLQAVGCAVGIQKLGEDEVVYVSSGEGACSQGDFHEAMNWAARDKLPVIFLIQNNEFAISVPIEEQLAGGSVYKLCAGYENLYRADIDGTDFEESYHIMEEAHSRALRGEGPALIEARVPRLESHSISDNQLKYRSAEDIERDSERDPLNVLSKLLRKRHKISENELDDIEQEIQKEIDEAAVWAEAQSDPDPAEAERFTYSENNQCLSIIEQQAKGPDVYMVDALNHALDEELERNPHSYIFGQDVAYGKGGVFTVTTGLTAKYGSSRVFNTQLAESAIAGVAIGMACRGLKPIAEIQFGDYIWTAMMQIRNELAMMRYRSGGDFSCPAVIRVPVGGYIHGACYHSQSIDGTFSHFPGLHILYPSNASDAKGLLKSAIRGDDPVLFLEHKGLYRQVYAKAAEGDENFLTPIGKAKVTRSGSDLSIITWGALVQKSLLAAQALEKEGVSVEVIDLRSIVPLDTKSIFESVKKTNRVLIAHEDVEFMGFGAELAAQIASHCFEYLDAPIKRVGMKYVAAVAHSPVIEDVVLPQNEDILVAARNVIEY